MADDDLFGPDGTQPLPAAPFLPDPLSGLVTGSVLRDTTVPVSRTAEPEEAPPEVRQAVEAVRRQLRQPAQRRSSAPGATTPNAIPVAESLPSRPRQARRPAATVRPTEVPLTPAARRQPPPARTVSAAGPLPRTAPVAPARRGSGCGLFLVVVLLLLVAFVVLGVVLGHGPGGFGGG